MSQHNSDASDFIQRIDDQVEQELSQALGEQSIEQLMEQTAAATPTPAPPDSAGPAAATDQDHAIGLEMIRGRIAAVRGDDVFVDLHGLDAKNQGVVPLTQFDRAPRIGSIMDFVVDRRDDAQGLVHLSREGAVSRAAWDQLRRGMAVEARVVGTNKGGLELELAGAIRAFMPASQVDLHYVESLDAFVGQKLRAQVHEVDLQHKKVVLSRRQLLEAERQAKQAKLWQELQPGLVLQGTVSGIADYGVFVDLGGVDGLVHVSDLSYSRVEKPADLVTVGQQVEVKVLKIDHEKQRISLGMKQAQPDPWAGVVDRLKVGDQLSARVVRLADFGVFVEVATGVEGLVPINELSWKRVHHPKEIVTEGDVIPLVVQRIEPEKHRISLSHKQAKGDPWTGAEFKYKTGSLVDATVQSITDFGAFVELEQGVEGLVHISQLADHRVDRVEDVLQVGEKQTFRVLEVDEAQRRISLSLKAVANPPSEASSSGKTSGSSSASAAAPPAKGKARKKPAKPLKGGLE